MYEPSDAGRALLMLIHGFGEHAGRYRLFAEELAAHGLVVVCPDLWGHGGSGGRRGDLGDLSTCAGELQQFAQGMLQTQPPFSSYALFGHSAGGLIAIQIAMDHPPLLRRLIVQSPLFAVGFSVPPWKRLSAQLLARLWPAAQLPMDLDLEALCLDRHVIDAYRNDPLVHNLMSAGTYDSLTKTAKALTDQAASMRTPTLLLCGSEDRIISIPAALAWFDRLSCERRQVIFPGCLHELHHEAILAEIVQRVVEWATA